MVGLREVLRFIANKLLIVIVVASLLLCSCSKSEEVIETESASEIGSTTIENLCYNSTVVNLPDMSMVIDTQYLEGAYYVFTKVYAKDYSDYHNELIEIKDGVIQNTTVFDIDFIAAKMCDQNTVAMISGGNAIIYDLNTSTVTNQSVIDGFTPNYYSSILALSDDGFVVAFDGNVILYDMDCNIVKRIGFSDITDVVDYFDGYLVLNQINPVAYNVDWDSNSVSFVGSVLGDFSSSEVWGKFVSGRYVFDDVSHDVYKIDNQDLSKTLCISGTNTLLYPGAPGTDDGVFIGIDDERYVVLHNSNVFNVELVIVEVDLDLNMSDREEIVLGGTNFAGSLYLDYLQYLYNSSQNEYRLVLDDYDLRIEEAGSVEAFQLELMKDLSEGKTPDIYFGNFYDYNYLGRNGYVVDLVPLFESDSEISIEDLQPSVRNMIVNSDGTCYQLMSGYYVNGMVGLEDYFPSSEVSIYDLNDLPQDINLYLGESSSNLLDDALIYSIEEIVEQNYKNTGTYDITEEQLIDLIEYAVNYGCSPDAYLSSGSSFYTDVLDSTVLLSKDAYMISQFQMFRSDSLCAGKKLTFVGYPSLYGSVHLANPEALMAISSSTEHLDACWMFVKCLLSEEMQVEQISSSNQRYPVVTKVMENYKYWIDNSSLLSADNLYKRAVKNLTPWNDGVVTDKDWEVYCEYAQVADTLIVRDFGLQAIVEQELADYYSANKSIEDIAKSMCIRINLYYHENYE